MKKKTTITISIVLGVLLLGVIIAVGSVYYGLQGIPESHIEENRAQKRRGG